LGFKEARENAVQKERAAAEAKKKAAAAGSTEEKAEEKKEAEEAVDAVEEQARFEESLVDRHSEAAGNEANEETTAFDLLRQVRRKVYDLNIRNARSNTERGPVPLCFKKVDVSKFETVREGRFGHFMIALKGDPELASKARSEVIYTKGEFGSVRDYQLDPNNWREYIGRVFTVLQFGAAAEGSTTAAGHTIWTNPKVIEVVCELFTAPIKGAKGRAWSEPVDALTAAVVRKRCPRLPLLLGQTSSVDIHS
jgi:hypothetical protein